MGSLNARKIDKNRPFKNLSIYKINKLHHGKCFVRFFIHELSCIRKLTRSLRSLGRFLILLNSWIKIVRGYARIFHGVISMSYTRPGSKSSSLWLSRITEWFLMFSQRTAQFVKPSKILSRGHLEGFLFKYCEKPNTFLIILIIWNTAQR